MSIAVLDEDVGVLPVLSDSQEFERKEPILSHDDKVGEETRHSLHDATLEIGRTDDPTVDKFVMLGIARFSFHDVAFGFLVGKGDGGDLINRVRVCACLYNTVHVKCHSLRFSQMLWCPKLVSIL